MAITKILQSTSPVELNAQIAEAMVQGLRPLGNVSVVDKGQGGIVGFYQTMTDTFPQDGASAYQVWLDAGNEGSVEEFFIAIAGQRVKTEAVWLGVNLLIPTTPTNLIQLLAGLGTPSRGTLAPFFRTTDNKMWPLNESSTMTFKFNMEGVWTGGSSTNRSMTLSFSNSVANTLNQNRISGIVSTTMSFPTFFSIDEGEELASAGSTLTIQAFGDTFTANNIILIAEQRSTQQ